MCFTNKHALPNGYVCVICVIIVAYFVVMGAVDVEQKRPHNRALRNCFFDVREKDLHFLIIYYKCIVSLFTYHYETADLSFATCSFLLLFTFVGAIASITFVISELKSSINLLTEAQRSECGTDGPNKEFTAPFSNISFCDYLFVSMCVNRDSALKENPEMIRESNVSHHNLKNVQTLGDECVLGCMWTHMSC